uniref:L1 transposable element RRM domain-containing protein n=1 Tax=Fundulus heteroclitus TaxID=8078 RepID=A0A3Q2NYR9_FUNHE
AAEGTRVNPGNGAKSLRGGRCRKPTRPKRKPPDDQSGDASEDDANATSKKAGVDSQQYTLLESIKTLSKDLREFKNEMKHDIEELKEDVKATMKEDLNRFREEMMRELQNQKGNITEAQTRIADLETACLEMKNELLETLEINKAMNDKLVDLESQSRRNNLRIYGVPEGKEDRLVSDFVTDLLTKQLKLSDGSDLRIQRARRALAPRPPPKTAPRSIIVNFLQFNTKEMILKKAWEQKVEMDGKRLYFDNDYASDVMERRKAYGPLKAALKQKGIRFQTPYTKMRIFWDSGVRTYENADETASDMIKRGFNLTWAPKENNLIQLIIKNRKLHPQKNLN